MTPQRAEDLVFVHSNLRLLSRRSPQYCSGETKMWDIAGDQFVAHLKMLPMVRVETADQYGFYGKGWWCFGCIGDLVLGDGWLGWEGVFFGDVGGDTEGVSGSKSSIVEGGMTDVEIQGVCVVDVDFAFAHVVDAHAAHVLGPLCCNCTDSLYWELGILIKDGVGLVLGEFLGGIRETSGFLLGF
ncbi:hypothetical protein Acr_15g0007270 [Actinidia rufa]|uniref:Uncharacterized protein n=1 Tax=Actinidia rufa TaxID=165716 RepID=A0A7J0FW06_9ERIC|nr:hypothetical protein Acr_15g0007270 [Actinidia rufa]